MTVYILKMFQTQNCIWYHSCSDSYSIIQYRMCISVTDETFMTVLWLWRICTMSFFFPFQIFIFCYCCLIIYEQSCSIVFGFFFFCYYWNALWITFHFHIYIIENCYSWYCLYIHVYILITNWQRTVFIFCQIDNAQTSSSKLLKQSFIDHFLNFSNATNVQDTHVF